MDMDEMWMRFLADLIDRVSGPLKFRLIVQPLAGMIFAVIAGLKDAKAGKSPYFYALLTDPAHRRDMLEDGWKSVGKVFVFALALDVIYQVIALHYVYPGEAVVVALALAIVPYLIVRGLVTRLARK